MIKAKVAICSIQKSTDEARMMYRLGLSLGQTNQYEVKIIGFPPKSENKIPNLQNYPLFSPHESKPGSKVLLHKTKTLLLEIQPDLVIFTHPRLLSLSKWVKNTLKSKLVYDVQENYYLNQLHLSRIPFFPIKWLRATNTRLKEKWASAYIDGFILAEKVYLKQLAFIKEKETIVFENKVQKSLIYSLEPSKNRESDNLPVFLLTGTISKLYGLIEFIKFTNYFSNQELKFKAYGHLTISNDAVSLQNLSRNKQVCIEYSLQNIPYSSILAEIKKCDAVLNLQPSNPAIDGKIPSKVYEAIAFQKPIIVNKELSWAEFIVKNGFGLAVDYQLFDPIQFLSDFNAFQSKNISPFIGIYSEEENHTLLQFIQKIKDHK